MRRPGERKSTRKFQGGRAAERIAQFRLARGLPPPEKQAAEPEDQKRKSRKRKTRKSR
jgi:hypothetical protein